MIAVIPNDRLRMTYIRAIFAATSTLPVGKGNTASVKRAYYSPGNTRGIVNTPSPEVFAKLGHHCAADPIKVDEPTASALAAAEVFREAGYEATVHDHPEPELPKGFMAFVMVPALNGIFLAFWPKNPDPAAVDAFHASGEFSEWTDNDKIE